MPTLSAPEAAIAPGAGVLGIAHRGGNRLELGAALGQQGGNRR